MRPYWADDTDETCCNVFAFKNACPALRRDRTRIAETNERAGPGLLRRTIAVPEIATHVLKKPGSIFGIDPATGHRGRHSAWTSARTDRWLHDRHCEAIVYGILMWGLGVKSILDELRLLLGIQSAPGGAFVYGWLPIISRIFIIVLPVARVQ
jgi:hypothetical protein